ncbi:MAG: SH3 domain-containing protein, partial [Marinomonas sp.]
GLKAGGDNFLSVRAVPSTSAAEIDRLLNGASVIMCEYDGDWVGIVYDKSGEKDCGTGSPIPEETTYTGVCDSGWISKDYVTLMAG